MSQFLPDFIEAPTDICTNQLPPSAPKIRPMKSPDIDIPILVLPPRDICPEHDNSPKPLSIQQADSKVDVILNFILKYT